MPSPSNKSPKMSLISPNTEPIANPMVSRVVCKVVFKVYVNGHLFSAGGSTFVPVKNEAIEAMMMQPPADAPSAKPMKKPSIRSSRDAMNLSTSCAMSYSASPTSNRRQKKYLGMAVMSRLRISGRFTTINCSV